MSDFDARARKAAAAVRQQVANDAPNDKRGIRRAQRPVRRWVVPSAAAVLVAAVAIATPGLIGGGNPTGSGGAYAAAAQLKPFGDCDAVLRYFVDQAPDHLIERARQSGANSGGAASRGGVVPAPAPAEDSTGAARREAPTHSTTNLQEVGVDEPDLIKTDGNRIVAVARGRVHLIEVKDGRMTRRKTLPVTDVSNLFLSGDRVLVFSQASGRTAGSNARWAGTRSVLTTYDITQLDQPKLVAALTIEGDVLDARLVGTQVRVATSSAPDLDIPSPVYNEQGEVSQESKEQLRVAVARSTVEDWIPSYSLETGSGRVSTGRLVECPDLARPEKFSGLDTVAVSAFDIRSAFTDRSAAGVVAGGQQLYASDTATYVTSTALDADTPTVTTDVHKFVTTPSGVTRYRGSGVVRGTLLNQYAMSEYNGVLRVASTISEERGWSNRRLVNEGMVTTFGERDRVLQQLGQVDGLGREDNESIQSVRFIADRGYVVTYRQTDPLYVVDLSDPAAPTVVGELKIPGYSGYLHPIGKDLLLGVGQSGEGKGRDGQVGVQFSLFDISDPAAPRRIATQTYGSGTASAEWDPKAFLYWQPRKLIVAPVMLDGDQRGRGTFTGVMLLRTDGSGLKELGRIDIRESDGMASRSLVIGDQVYLLSDQALQSHSLDNHRQIDRLRL